MIRAINNTALSAILTAALVVTSVASAATPQETNRSRALLNAVAGGYMTATDALHEGPSGTWIEGIKALDKRYARTATPAGVSQAMIAAARANRPRAAHGRLDAETAAPLIALAWPVPDVPSDLELTVSMTGAQRTTLQKMLTSGRHMTDAVMADALAIALTTGSVHQRSRLVGVLDPNTSQAPLLHRIIGQRKGMLERLIKALAARPYPDTHAWVSVYRNTVRSLARDILVKGTPDQRRAVATFPVDRARAIGVVDGAVMDIARTAMQLQDNRAMMVRPIYNLWRDDRELAAPLMDLLSLKAPSLDDSGPFDLDDRVAGLEEEMCGVDEALEQDMIDDVPTDDKAARLRALVMTATDKQLAILDAHDSGPNAGATSRALAYRRCEIMLKRTDVTDVADESARKGAAGQAIRCLS
ncbi:MAG: hypothetical protein ACI9WU_003935, partial [Myxococcota bacterium]